VVAQAIRFDYELEIRPEEVDLETVHGFAGQGRPQTRPSSYWEKAALELGVGEREGEPIEKLPQDPHAATRADSVKRRAQSFRVDEIKLVGLVNRGLEGVASNSRGDVDKGAGGSCDRDALANGEILRT
jgi:hypothetical protein